LSSESKLWLANKYLLNLKDMKLRKSALIGNGLTFVFPAIKEPSPEVYN